MSEMTREQLKDTILEVRCADDTTLFGHALDSIMAHDASLRAKVDNYRTDRDTTYEAMMATQAQLEAVTRERDVVQKRYEKQCEGTMSRIRLIDSLKQQLATAIQERDQAKKEAL